MISTPYKASERPLCVEMPTLLYHFNSTHDGLTHTARSFPLIWFDFDESILFCSLTFFFLFMFGFFWNLFTIILFLLII